MDYGLIPTAQNPAQKRSVRKEHMALTRKVLHRNMILRYWDKSVAHGSATPSTASYDQSMNKTTGRLPSVGESIAGMRTPIFRHP
jgi:hypothetical protein